MRLRCDNLDFMSASAKQLIEALLPDIPKLRGGSVCDCVCRSLGYYDEYDFSTGYAEPYQFHLNDILLLDAQVEVIEEALRSELVGMLMRRHRIAKDGAVEIVSRALTRTHDARYWYAPKAYATLTRAIGQSSDPEWVKAVRGHARAVHAEGKDKVLIAAKLLLEQALVWKGEDVRQLVEIFERLKILGEDCFDWLGTETSSIYENLRQFTHEDPDLWDKVERMWGEATIDWITGDRHGGIIFYAYDEEGKPIGCGVGVSDVDTLYEEFSRGGEPDRHWF